MGIYYDEGTTNSFSYSDRQEPNWLSMPGSGVDADGNHLSSHEPGNNINWRLRVTKYTLGEDGLKVHMNINGSVWGEFFAKSAIQTYTFDMYLAPYPFSLKGYTYDNENHIRTTREYTGKYWNDRFNNISPTYFGKVTINRQEEYDGQRTYYFYGSFNIEGETIDKNNPDTADDIVWDIDGIEPDNSEHEYGILIGDLKDFIGNNTDKSENDQGNSDNYIYICGYGVYNEDPYEDVTSSYSVRLPLEDIDKYINYFPGVIKVNNKSWNNSNSCNREQGYFRRNKNGLWVDRKNNLLHSDNNTVFILNDNNKSIPAPLLGNM